MARRRVSSFQVGAAGSWFGFALSDASIPRVAANFNLRAALAPRGEYSRTFVVRTLRCTRFRLPQIQFGNRE